MDTLKRLKFDANGIIGVLHGYSDEPMLINLTDQFQKSLEHDDIESLLYALEQLKTWYHKNWIPIHRNQYVYDKSVHLETLNKIKIYLEELPLVKKTEEAYAISHSESKESVNHNKEFEKKIFISHSSKDKTACDAFVDLLEGIGVPSEDIIYTSSPYHGIPGDDNIFDYLRKHLFKGAYVCYMLSDNYYDSVYCLNEMGATWVNSNNSSTFKLPGFEGEIKGVIDKNKKAYSLEEPIEVYDFKEKILRMYDLTLDPKKWERIKSSFYENLK
ncbi:hypothetical protein UZ38_10870 [Bacillus amyloliquefaciens]|nr:hypothetical protein UZ38_10870 [Bacillus amyloliquefaciens]